METLKKLRIEHLLIVFLLVLTATLRFVNLGYSDYIGDEHKAFFQPIPGQTTWNFIMSRRKGPMQFLVSAIPYQFTHDYRNELAQRIPFAAISVSAVIVFYFLVKKMTQNKLVAFVSAFLLSVNGFMVGFGRIAQYQNLNLLFSFLALFFYFDLLNDSKKETHLKSSRLGTLFYSLSVLSHWDAIFILPVVIYIFIKRKDLELAQSNFRFGCLLLVPFLVPYTFYQLISPANSAYFGRRIELGHSNLVRYKLLIDLYNPYLTFWFLSVVGIIGAFRFKKNLPIFLWFLFGFLGFELFVRKPGTHIYNFVIPAIILAALGVDLLLKIKYLRTLAAVGLVFLLPYFYWQSCMVFLDHSKEYPWEQKRIFELRELGITEQKRLRRKLYGDAYIKIYNFLRTETPKHTLGQKLPLFGFPHYRAWNEINEYIGGDVGYVTNEVKTISEWYMDVPYRLEGTFYVVGVRKPLSFVNDWKVTNIGNKEKVHEIYNETGDIIVRIYLVEE
ncbi:glycosyltransferase family 39 protein [bacterium]|nr:glycosyltransferase family 39 protein [bacterium]